MPRTRNALRLPSLVLIILIHYILGGYPHGLWVEAQDTAGGGTFGGNTNGNVNPGTTTPGGNTNGNLNGGTSGNTNLAGIVDGLPPCSLSVRLRCRSEVVQICIDPPMCAQFLSQTMHRCF